MLALLKRSVARNNHFNTSNSVVKRWKQRSNWSKLMFGCPDANFTKNRWIVKYLGPNGNTFMPYLVWSSLKLIYQYSLIKLLSHPCWILTPKTKIIINKILLWISLKSTVVVKNCKTKYAHPLDLEGFPVL